MKKKIGWFMIAAGVSMVFMWTFFLVTGRVPELNSTPYAIFTHILAELASGMMMVFEGIGLVQAHPNSERRALYALGMFVYAVIQAPGYYLEKGEYLFVAMFFIFLAIGLVSVRYLAQAK